MNVVIRVSPEDRARAWGILVRHSPGTALPDNTFIVSNAAIGALHGAGVAFTEIARADVDTTLDGVAALERI